MLSLTPAFAWKLEDGRWVSHICLEDGYHTFAWKMGITHLPGRWVSHICLEDGYHTFAWKMGITHLPGRWVSHIWSQYPFPELTQYLTSWRCVVNKCTRNCSCTKSQVPCCVAYKCVGKEVKCGCLVSLRTRAESNGSDETGTDN